MLGPRHLNRGWWMWTCGGITRSSLHLAAKQIEFFSRAQNLTCCDGSPARLWRLKWSLSDYRLLSFSWVSQNLHPLVREWGSEGVRAAQSPTVSETGNVERETKSPVIATSTPTLTGFTDCKMFGRDRPVLDCGLWTVGDNLLCKWHKIMGYL